jgi:hypothetical protein
MLQIIMVVQSCNDIYMHTKHIDVIDFNMLYPHRSPFQVHLFSCDYLPMMTNVTINHWPFRILWSIIVPPYELAWNIFVVFKFFKVFSHTSWWYVTGHDIITFPKPWRVLGIKTRMATSCTWTFFGHTMVYFDTCTTRIIT